MRKGVALAVFVGTLFFAGVALADQLKLVSFEGTETWRGQYNFETVPPNEFLWGYCTEEHVNSNINTWYNYELRAITGYFGAKPNFGLDAADLIWREYHDGSVTNAEKTQLQYAIWNLWTNYDSNFQRVYSDELLESLFSIAYITNVVNGGGLWGQDFIVFDPVPEPATMLLLGFGLIGLAAIGRRKLA